MCLPKFDLSNVLLTTTNNTFSLTSTEFLLFGSKGVFQSFPYVLYLMVCFEVLPCLAEETKNMEKHTSRGMLTAVFSLLAMSWISLIVSAGLPPGMGLMQQASFPFSEFVSSVYPISQPQLYNLLTLPACLCSQLGIYLAVIRLTYGLSRGGFFPTSWSMTTDNGAPWSSMTICVVGQIALCSGIKFAPSSSSLIFLHIGDFCVMIPYLIEPVFYMKIKYSMPTLPRKLKSPFSFAGALVNVVIAAVFLVGATIVDRTWQWIMLGYVIFFVLLIPFFYLVVRKNLRSSPERIFIESKLKAQIEDINGGRRFGATQQAS